MGLVKLGFQVTIINQPSKRISLEGLSSRTIDILKSLNANTTLHTLNTAVRRLSRWSDKLSNTSQEWIVNRKKFDSALLIDAENSGVKILSGRVISTQIYNESWQVHWSDSNECRCHNTLNADFIVEARGRSTPRHQQSTKKGPAAYAIGQRWKLSKPHDGSLVVSLENGWAWWASTGYQALFQYVVGDIGKLKLSEHYQQSIDQVPEVQHWLNRAVATTNLSVCGARLRLFDHPTGDRWLRVGDAALAPDPLSGQGVFEAVACALAAVPTINTMLRLQVNTEIARSFYRDRCHDRFYGIARSGRDFYQMEKKLNNTDFWSARQNWPDHRPSHPDPRSEKSTIKERPVVIENFIHKRSVVITPDHPRGILNHSNVPLVPLLNYIESGGTQAALQFETSEQHINAAQHWLKQREML